MQDSSPPLSAKLIVHFAIPKKFQRSQISGMSTAFLEINLVSLKEWHMRVQYNIQANKIFVKQ